MDRVFVLRRKIRDADRQTHHLDVTLLAFGFEQNETTARPTFTTICHVPWREHNQTRRSHTGWEYRFLTKTPKFANAPEF